MVRLMERCVAATLRVHILAKELGVPSKAIIDKCHAEGIELKNHMAAISIGLAESIREWFSNGDDVTSVEVAERVDVEVVRKARRKARHGEAEGEVAVEVAPEPTAAPEPGPQTLEPTPEAGAVIGEARVVPAEAGEVVAPAPLIELPEQPPAPSVETLAARAPTAEPAEAPPPAPPAIEPEAVTEPQTGPAPVVFAPPPPPPEPIRPAGPQVVPAPAELKGPTLVRIEAPEPHVGPRPRSAVARGPAGAPAGTTTAAVPPRRGRAKGRKTEEEEAAAFRARSPRRHGATSDVDQRLREWRDQDLLERKERLASVTGHGLRDRRAAECGRKGLGPGFC